jgi:hypothetical protein
MYPASGYVRVPAILSITGLHIKGTLNLVRVSSWHEPDKDKVAGRAS